MQESNKYPVFELFNMSYDSYRFFLYHNKYAINEKDY